MYIYDEHNDVFDQIPCFKSVYWNNM